MADSCARESVFTEKRPHVSIIMPMRNAEEFLPDALESILKQTYVGSMELLVFDDGPSTDQSVSVIASFEGELLARNISVKVLPGNGGPRGCGYGRNRCIEASAGDYLCFADADDIMAPERIKEQLELAESSPKALVGSDFTRIPEDATPRFTQWANSLSHAQLVTQQLVETTIIAPTWFCSRELFDTAGPFDESGPGTPDDLMFFYHHITLGGDLAKVGKPLVRYRFHDSSVTGSRGVAWEKIWDVRVAHFQDYYLKVLSWQTFTIWNAGKEGRRLYRSLSLANKVKVQAFCDIADKYVSQGFYEDHANKKKVPILHWREAKPPLLLCVKRGFSGGAFEANVSSLDLQEGSDYVYFC